MIVLVFVFLIRSKFTSRIYKPFLDHADREPRRILKRERGLLDFFSPSQQSVTQTSFPEKRLADLVWGRGQIGNLYQSKDYNLIPDCHPPPPPPPSPPREKKRKKFNSYRYNYNSRQVQESVICQNRKTRPLGCPTVLLTDSVGLS